MANEARLEGRDELMKTLRNIERKAPDSFGAALYAEALIVEQVSRERTPVLTGALRASHETTRPEKSSEGVSVSILCGGPAAPYAVVVHYNLEAHHKNGQALFLESAVLEAVPTLTSRLAARLDVSGLVK